MVKWDDKHMYNWIGWMRSLINVRERINDWTVSPMKSYKFYIFMANNVILSPVLFFIVGLMLIPQTIEWSMSLLMRWVNKEMERGALDSIKGFPVVMATLFILIPYTVTWGLPKLIGEIKQRRVEKRLERQRRELQDALDRRRKEDFRPKKIIKPYQFGDTPKIRIFTRDEFVIGYNRVWNTSTARTTRRNRRGR